LTANERLTVIGYNRQGRDFALCELSGEATEDGKLMNYERNAGYGMSGAPIVSIENGET
jgi:hypothetical protein